MGYIDEIISGFSALLIGLTGDNKDLKDLSDKMEQHIETFRKENRAYFERGYKIPYELKHLKDIILEWQKENYLAHSGMDIDKGLFNETDWLYIMSEKWVNMIDGYYPCSKEFAIDDIETREDLNNVEYRQDRAIIDDIITDKVRKYYTRAIDEGWIIETDYGYKWKWGEPRGKARLGYFIKKAYDPDGFGVIPYKALGTLFGVKRLDSTIYQLVGGKPKWQDEIDNKVFYD